MTAYLKKNTKTNLDDPNYIDSFENLKTLITSEPILKYPDFSKKFTLTTDASYLRRAIQLVLQVER